MKKLNLSLTFFTVAIIITAAYSCKKDRIEAPKDKQLNAYTPLNTYLETKKQEEQEFIINGPSNDTITGNQNTKIIGGKNCLVDANGDPIDYPFSIHLVELYTPEDMIYWQMPTVAGGNILETDGEIRIRATKNGQALSLVCPYTFWMPNANPDNNMTIYTGTDNGSFVDWTNSTTAFNIIGYGYEGSSTELGWINADKQVGTGSGHTLTFTSSVDDLTNVGIFIYFPASRTVMQAYNSVSGLIPNGSDVNIVMMAQDASGQLFSYTETRTVNSSATIDLSLSQTTDSDLTNYLKGL